MIAFITNCKITLTINFLKLHYKKNEIKLSIWKFSRTFDSETFPLVSSFNILNPFILTILTMANVMQKKEV